jgi:hypothetical protein
MTFAVTLARACADDTVSVTYSVSGTATLRVAPPRLGSKTDTTRYQLRVTKGGKMAHAAQDMVVYRGEEMDTLVLGPSRRHGADSIVVKDSIRTDLWPDFVCTRGIALASGRPIAIAHNGKTAVVGAQLATSMLDGSPIAGDWDLRPALLPGERFVTVLGGWKMSEGSVGNPARRRCRRAEVDRRQFQRR